MATPSAQLDPVAVITTIAAAFVGQAFAPIVGAYTVIAVAAITGAAWGLGRREPAPRIGAAIFVTRLTLTALLTTWGIAALLQRWVPWIEETTWLLAPVALVIGAVGDDWPAIGRGVVARLRRRVDRDLGGSTGAHSSDREPRP